jgi:acetyl-CoA C-acetyltransferase
VPKEVPSFTVNKACGSGLKAAVLAAQAIQLDQADAIVAGGMESMSGAPYLLKKARFGVRMGHDELLDSMIADGLTCPITFVHMGVTAENIAAKYGIPREEQDEFAAESQAKTAAAQKAGKFKAEIVAVPVPQKKGDPVLVDEDEGPKKAQLDKMPGLKPAFSKDGTVTAANASSINDGGAALVVTSAAVAQKHGLPVLARIVADSTAAVEPKWFTIAPVEALRKLYAKTNTKSLDWDLYEINEAFSGVTMAAMKDHGIPHERVNVHGGAVSLGHPIGCSGARILVTLLHALKDRGERRGIATLCIGGGEAVALGVELV